MPLGADCSAVEKRWVGFVQEMRRPPKGNVASRGPGLSAEQIRHKLSIGFVFGLAGVTRLFARVAPVVRLGARRVVAPRRLVKDRQTLKGLAGQGLWGKKDAKD